MAGLLRRDVHGLCDVWNVRGAKHVHVGPDSRGPWILDAAATAIVHVGFRVAALVGQRTADSLLQYHEMQLKRSGEVSRSFLLDGHSAKNGASRQRIVPERGVTQRQVQLPSVLSKADQQAAGSGSGHSASARAAAAALGCLASFQGGSGDASTAAGSSVAGGGQSDPTAVKQEEGGSNNDAAKDGPVVGVPPLSSLSGTLQPTVLN